MAILTGNSDNNTIQGTAYADEIRGWGGADTLYGNDGNDILWGGTGQDRVNGGAGNDSIRGESDATADQVWGGTGADTFYFNVRSSSIGQDSILDFSRSQGDKVSVDGQGVNALMSYVDNNKDGTVDSTLIKLSSGTSTPGTLGTISITNALLTGTEVSVKYGVLTTTSTLAPTTPTPGSNTGGVLAPTAPNLSTSHLYVSPNGSDSNSGTVSSPFKTIQKAANVVTAGTTVHVASGTYAATVTTTKDGTASAPIRFVSDVEGGAKIMPVGYNATNGAIWKNSGDYVTIEGFDIDGSASPMVRTGITLAGSHSYAKDNHVHHILLNGSRDSGGGGGIVANGAYWGDVDQNIVNNYVHHIGGDNSDARVHGIYHYGTGSIVNNVVYSTPQGMVLWHDAHDMLIANNTVFNNDTSGISVGAGDFYKRQGPADNVRVINNLVYDNGGVGIDEHGLTGTNNVYQNNLVYKNGSSWGLQNGNTHSGTISSDPQFVNYRADGGGDYHLSATSPAIDKGTSSFAAPNIDIDGYLRTSARDIGAYEWSML